MSDLDLRCTVCHAMLDEEDLEARVRLSCQIVVTPELEGMVVEVLATRP